MRSLVPVTMCCISLLTLQQLLALPVGIRLESNRLDFIKRLKRETGDDSLDSAPAPVEPAGASPVPPLDSTAKWRALLFKHPPPTHAVAAHLSADAPLRAWAAGEAETQRASRGRRHANSGRGHHHGHHAQLMRVGCVLGTCQVQNLSHRLYQLIGQSGREDSSPINPRSPHSYG